MQKLTRDTLQNLLETNTDLAVTIYIPMHTTASPPHISENQIRFKNLLHKAAGQARQKDSKLAEALEAKVDELYNDLAFWEDQTAGLLICAAKNNIEMYHLPVDTEEYVAVDKQFHLAPIMGLIDDAHDFYVLALAQHEPKLFKGSMYDLEPSPIKLPASVKEALNIDESNQKSEMQGTANAPSNNTTWFNGRGGARNPQEEDRLRFFRLIDKILYDKADRKLPLILAGVESETVEFRKISKYPKLLQSIIPGNHSSDDLRILFEAAKEIIWQELTVPEHKSAIEEYQRVGGAHPERVARDIKNIAEAALQGRIDKLLARFSRKTTDTVRDKLQPVQRITFPADGDAKKLNDIALTVWQNSGRVYNLMPDEMPGGQLMAARLRY